jgi:hypothetical protein
LSPPRRLSSSYRSRSRRPELDPPAGEGERSRREEPAPSYETRERFGSGRRSLDLDRGIVDQ